MCNSPSPARMCLAPHWSFETAPIKPQGIRSVQRLKPVSRLCSPCLIWQILCKNPCPSVVNLAKALQTKDPFDGWTATVSETVSKAESHSTIRHYLPELAETLSPHAFTDAVETELRSFLILNPIAFNIVRHPKRAIKREESSKQWPQTNTQARNAHCAFHGILNASASIRINIE